MSRRVADQDSGADHKSSAIGKAFTIIRALRRAGSPMTLTALAEAVGTAPSSAHSLVTQLLDAGAVTQDSEKRYSLGPSMFYVGSAFARSTPLYRSVWIELITAANEYAVTAAIALPWESHHLVLNAHRAGDSDVAIPFGGRVPLDAASWGKTYYAWSGAALPGRLASYTVNSIASVQEFTKEVERTRLHGYATDREEFSIGVRGVAAAVTSANGYEGLASFLGPATRLEDEELEKLGRRLTDLTARASRTLGDSSRMRLFGSE
jgi:IclR family acetate operon transcriptional repressor